MSALPIPPTDAAARRPARLILAAAPGRWTGLSEALAAAGHEVARCDSADDAVERALEHDLDALLLDRDVPGIGAEAAADILRRMGRELRLVALVDDAAAPTAPAPGLFDDIVAAGPASTAAVHDALALAVAATDADADADAAQEAAFAEEVKALSSTFEADLPVLHRALAAALALGDPAALRAPCHRLRGTAGLFGREAVAALAARAETAIDDGRLDEAFAAGREIADHLRLDPAATLR